MYSNFLIILSLFYYNDCASVQPFLSLLMVVTILLILYSLFLSLTHSLTHSLSDMVCVHTAGFNQSQTHTFMHPPSHTRNSLVFTFYHVYIYTFSLSQFFFPHVCTHACTQHTHVLHLHSKVIGQHVHVRTYIHACRKVFSSSKPLSHTHALMLTHSN